MILAGWALAAELRGRVSDSDGAPVADAQVWGVSVSGYQGPALTDAAGDYVLELPAGLWRSFVLPPVQHAPSVGATGLYDCAQPGLLLGDEDVGEMDLVVGPGRTVRGRVLDAEGLPVAGALVSVSQSSAAIWDPVYTDAEGRFSIAAFPDGYSLALEIEAEGLPSQYFRGGYGDPAFFVVDGDTDLGDGALTGGISVHGSVVGPDGPVDGGAVYAYSGGQALGVAIAADGSYEVVGLPPGEVTVWAVVEGLAQTYWPGTDRPTDTLPAPEVGAEVQADLELPVESRLRVRLSGEGDVAETYGAVYNDAWTVGHSRGADEDGVIEFEALWPGDWYLGVQGGGFVDTVWGGDDYAPIAVDGETEIELPMELGASLRGRVVDEDGEGLPASSVQLYADAWWSGSPDDVGAWAIDSVQAGWFTLSAYPYVLCDGDPTWTFAWWPEARSSEFAEDLHLELGESRDAGDLVLHTDADADGMGDDWERDNDLDPERDDAAEDPDQDGYTNLREWELDTDPTSEHVEGCGCAGGAAAPWALFIAVVPALRARAPRRRRSGPGRG